MTALFERIAPLLSTKANRTSTKLGKGANPLRTYRQSFARPQALRQVTWATTQAARNSSR